MTTGGSDSRGGRDHLTLGAPRRFTSAAKIRMQCFSAPLFGLMGGGFGLIIGGCGLVIADAALGFSVLGNPSPQILIGFALSAPGFYFIPYFCGNTRISGWFASRAKGTEVVGLTLMPRRRAGMECFDYGEDDVGVLSIEPDHLIYSGDAIDFRLSRAEVQAMTARGVGWRGLWALGDAVDLMFAQPIAGVVGLTLTPRRDATLPAYRRSARRLESSLRRWLDGKIVPRRESRPVSPQAHWRRFRVRRVPAVSVAAAAAVAAALGIALIRASAEKRALKERLASSYAAQSELYSKADDAAAALSYSVESNRLAPSRQARADVLALLAELDIPTRVWVEDYAVSAAAFSPDGKIILTGGWGKTARLRDARTGASIGKPLRHEGAILAAAFSPDGRTALTGSQDNTARLWDARTGEPLGPVLRHEGAVRAVAFSPDGKTVLTGSWDKTARLWDARTGAPVGKVMRHQGAVWAAAYSPGGRTVLTGSGDKTARLWDARTGAPVGKAMLHEDEVRAVAFSPDGKTVLTCGWDKTARLWDARTGAPVGKAMRHKSRVWAVAFSPDGKTVLAGGYDKTARLWDARTGAPRGKVMRHEGAVLAVAFSPDGQTALTGGEDKTARLWDVGGSAGQAAGDDLALRAYASTNMRIDARGGLEAIPLEELPDVYKRLRAKSRP